MSRVKVNLSQFSKLTEYVQGVLYLLYIKQTLGTLITISRPVKCKSVRRMHSVPDEITYYLL